MPTITVPKKQLEPPPALPPGIYDVRMDGFKPKSSKKGDSINLQPQMKIVNHPQLNNSQVFENLNQGAGWVIQDFCHAFGVPMTDAGEGASLPGEFQGPDGEPDKWTYIGPLSGRVGKVELIEVPATDKQGQAIPGKTRSTIKRYICAIPGCQVQHTENLAK